MFKNTHNPTRFKLDIEKRLMNLKMDLDDDEDDYEDDYEDEDYDSSENHKMFKKIIVDMYELGML